MGHCTTPGDLGQHATGDAPPGLMNFSLFFPHLFEETVFCDRTKFPDIRLFVFFSTQGRLVRQKKQRVREESYDATGPPSGTECRTSGGIKARRVFE